MRKNQKKEKEKEKTRHYDGSFLERENVWLG
jgi:hypothetical protein